MNTTENQNDPYSYLKQAWEAGRRIRCRDVRGDWTLWLKKGGGFGYGWDVPPERYEIEPLPADKWAAEKAAHAQGKRIEWRYLNADRTGWYKWLECPHPIWAENGTVEYRIAPDPAPADKLTDEKLGEIGAKAAAITINRPERVDYFTMTVTARSAFYDRDEPARTAFASAVREAVEEEKADREQANLDELMSLREELKVKTNWLVDATKAEDALRAEVKAKTKWLDDANRGAQTNALVNQSLTRKVIEMQAVEAKQADEIARLTAEFSELEAKYTDMCTRLQDCVQTHKLGLGGEKIDKLVVEAVANLIAKLENQASTIVKAAAEKHKLLAIIEQAIEMVNTPGTTKDNLPQAINAELERLRWRSPKIKPSREDADITGRITVLKRDGIVTQILWYSEELNAFEAWRPCCPPPAPSAEEVERAEFAAFWDRSELAGIVKEEGAFKIWQAARAAKEGEK